MTAHKSVDLCSGSNHLTLAPARVKCGRRSLAIMLPIAIEMHIHVRALSFILLNIAGADVTYLGIRNIRNAHVRGLWLLASTSDSSR